MGQPNSIGKVEEAEWIKGPEEKSQMEAETFGGIFGIDLFPIEDLGGSNREKRDTRSIRG